MNQRFPAISFIVHRRSIASSPNRASGSSLSSIWASPFGRHTPDAGTSSIHWKLPEAEGKRVTHHSDGESGQTAVAHGSRQSCLAWLTRMAGQTFPLSEGGDTGNDESQSLTQPNHNADTARGRWCPPRPGNGEPLPTGCRRWSRASRFGNCGERSHESRRRQFSFSRYLPARPRFWSACPCCPPLIGSG